MGLVEMGTDLERKSATMCSSPLNEKVGNHIVLDEGSSDQVFFGGLANFI